MNSPSVRYLKKHFDDAAILACLADLAFKPEFKITEDNWTILSALKRSSEEFRNADLGEIGNILSIYSDEQIKGLLNNVKGIAHEMEFVRIENSDGDGIYASMYSDANNPEYDIEMYDETTGEMWPVQLKASDNAYYVEQWIEEHPEGEIIVTDELADELDLQGTGIENGQLTAHVEEFVDKLIEHGGIEALESYFPSLTVATSAVVIWELWQRYQKGEISLSEFNQLAALAAGTKAFKIGAVMALMLIPGVNVATGAALIAKMILSAKNFASDYLGNLHLPGKKDGRT